MWPRMWHNYVLCFCTLNDKDCLGVKDTFLLAKIFAKYIFGNFITITEKTIFKAPDLRGMGLGF